MNKIEAKLEDLMNERQFTVHTFIACTGGTIGLFLLPFTLKTVPFIIIGLYYIFVLLSNYVNLDKCIKEIIIKMEV
ncbi:MAG: hypothetical protein LBJ74_01260 [Heliobacteriaceae bacterium]|jgi:hypothetical protein|nr:hypothetical protein [Heliobacteriaceae bacterium]